MLDDLQLMINSWRFTTAWQPQDDCSSSTRLDDSWSDSTLSFLLYALYLFEESVLFGDNPATKRNNFFLDVWQDCQSTLPPLLTGGSDTNNNNYDNNNNDNNVDPAARLYNMIFVRGPTIIVGLFYVKNTVTGHPLIVDIGDGPFEVSPLIVAGLLYMILRFPSCIKMEWLFHPTWSFVVPIR